MGGLIPLPAAVDGLSFGAPDRLLLVLVVGALALAYVALQARGPQYTARFTNLELIDSVLPKRPEWRRHVPAALSLAALGFLALGLAHPGREHMVARRRGVIVLAVDVSPSMMATDVSPSREQAAQQAVLTALNAIPSSVQVGLVSVAGTAAVEVYPTTDHDQVRQKISKLQFRSETSLADAVTTSLAAIGATAGATSGPSPPAGIILLSDGGNTIGEGLIPQAMDQARKDHVPVSTVVVGTSRGVITLGTNRIPVPVDAPDLEHIASGTGGQTFRAATASRLMSIYHHIGGAVARDPERQDLIGWFTGVAFILAMLAGLFSLWWFARIP